MRSAVIAMLLAALAASAAAADLAPFGTTAGTATELTPLAFNAELDGDVSTTITFFAGTTGANGARGTAAASFDLAMTVPGPGAYTQKVTLAAADQFAVRALDLGYSYRFISGTHDNLGEPIVTGLDHGAPLLARGGLNNDDEIYGDAYGNGVVDWDGWYWFGGYGEPESAFAGLYMRVWDNEGHLLYDNSDLAVRADDPTALCWYEGPGLDWGDQSTSLRSEQILIGAFEIGFVTEVPEPTSIILLALAGLAIRPRR